MPIYQQIIFGVFALVAILIAVKLFTTPIRWVLKFVLNTLLGFAALIIFNLLGEFTGIYLGVNLLNALIIGILGLPGFGLLLLLKWLFAL